MNLLIGNICQRRYLFNGLGFHTRQFNQAVLIAGLTEQISAHHRGRVNHRPYAFANSKHRADLLAPNTAHPITRDILEQQMVTIQGSCRDSRDRIILLLG
ncbi:hypothetical protein [uncultured Ruegeria sp.]|uniref:hypothetical protein n=1 Tax=uncultured Ruegeria sp. TaxID=259304 RepID=UPI0026238BA3|nr:hypothetical protein [uncultured Ruegeria sp.]